MTLPPRMVKRLSETPRRPASLRHAHRRLRHLYEIGTLLVQFEGVEQTLPAVLALLGQTLPLRSAVFDLARSGDAIEVGWCADDTNVAEFEAAKARARLRHRWLANVDADRSGEHDEASMARETPPPPSADALHVLTLPLVVDHQPIFGALHIESTYPLNELDLTFVNAIVNQVSIALDRQAIIDSRQATTEAGKIAAEAQRDTLRDADLRKDEFLATLSHELRTPLAALSAAAQLLNRPQQKTPAPAVAHDVLNRQIHHMRRLLDDLLEVSRITHGRIQLRKERLDVAEAVAAVIEAARPMIAAKRHAVTVEIRAAPLYVYADRVRLMQIFSNLITNAVKYTDDDGAIGVEMLLEDQVVIRVIDSGIGISAEMLPNVFRMFSQVTSAVDRSEGGLGIGLALAKNLVEMHGGTVSAHSDGLGCGSEFVVRLPPEQARLPTPAPTVERRPFATRAATSRKVLMADDNRDAADSLAALLELGGHEVRTAYDGEQAFDLADSFRPSVILLDIGMPKMNGYDVAKRIRAQPWGAAMTLVAITGWGQPGDKRRASASGFDHHLTKPVALETLESLVSGPAMAER